MLRDASGLPIISCSSSERSDLSPSLFAAQQVYKMRFLPLTEYGSMLYGGAKLSLLAKLQVVQNKCLHPHCLSKCSVSCKRNLLIQAYLDVTNGIYLDQGRREMRVFTSPVLSVPKFKKKQAYKAVAYQRALCWNDLPSQTRAIKTLASFKTAISNRENIQPG